MQKIQMVDLLGQYNKIKEEVNEALENVILTTSFINGPQVSLFEKQLAEKVGVKNCIACANGTDALQIAMMALDLKPEDEIIVPAFTYIATVEAAALLGIKLVLVDVDKRTFNVSVEGIEKAINKNTKAIIPVHLFGQCADMEGIMKLAKTHNLFVIEDTAQAIGADYIFSDGTKKKAGTIGDIGTTSFFPSKNLGCYGDGGAMFTDNDALAKKIKMIANHGQNKKYYHEIVGLNSRLDTMQAAILLVKLKQLTKYCESRQSAAQFYDKALSSCTSIAIPFRNNASTHVFHQYSILLKDGEREKFKEYLEEKGIPSMVYYPLPVHYQVAYSKMGFKKGDFPITEEVCEKIISLPMHTELEEEQLDYICKHIIDYFKK